MDFEILFHKIQNHHLFLVNLPEDEEGGVQGSNRTAVVLRGLESRMLRGERWDRVGIRSIAAKWDWEEEGSNLVWRRSKGG
ncbi:G-type lectin S-receptor-like serine/threonine-protein kinase [Pyrus ussuriensis x Pyrus communis]|uniref:G-type lectin S-receptor-like serine/threonine-protein kinase n=1 Tax=Pyrus ussuriensis x Pyrus communis TaxID=2448454 RepID=A0A5N5GUC4_9ROSA|nr:G-type lectin S-receptor-like serine/threonine-protein kinase [Pyrus ussuriensis x Pyrus communis]